MKLFQIPNPQKLSNNERFGFNWLRFKLEIRAKAKGIFRINVETIGSKLKREKY